jgi:hypothetical protein
MEAMMFKRIVLLFAFAATLMIGSFAMPREADAWRRGWNGGRPFVGRSYPYFYGPSVYYGRPYRSYYRGHYAPRYYDPYAYSTYYGPGYGYYSYQDYYYSGPRGRVAFSVGF